MLKHCHLELPVLFQPDLLKQLHLRRDPEHLRRELPFHRKVFAIQHEHVLTLRFRVLRLHWNRHKLVQRLLFRLLASVDHLHLELQQHEPVLFEPLLLLELPVGLLQQRDSLLQLQLRLLLVLFGGVLQPVQPAQFGLSGALLQHLPGRHLQLVKRLQFVHFALQNLRDDGDNLPFLPGVDFSERIVHAGLRGRVFLQHGSGVVLILRGKLQRLHEFDRVHNLFAGEWNEFAVLGAVCG